MLRVRAGEVAAFAQHQAEVDARAEMARFTFDDREIRLRRGFVAPEILEATGARELEIGRRRQPREHPFELGEMSVVAVLPRRYAHRRAAP